MTVVAVVQARLGSTRLPGKVVAEVAGEPLLAHAVLRAHTMPVDEVVVATTDRVGDDPLAELCSGRGWRCLRGSDEDVLDRYRGVAEATRADVVVRVTADCPFVAADQARRVLDRLAAAGADCAHNLTIFDSGMPLGTGVEVVTRETLEACWREGREAHHREHVLEYVYEHPERFATERVEAPEALRRPGYRLTVDTAVDLELVRRVHERLAGAGPLVPLADVVALLDGEPELRDLNRHILQRRL